VIIERRSRWVISIRSDGDIHLRVFCFPYAGAGASLFRAWAPSLPEGLELCAVQLPGREDRMAESPYRSLAALAPRVVAELDPFLDRPFALFGHSVGAFVAYETARSLCASGRPPVHLFVSGQRAPHLPSRMPPRHALPPVEFEAALARLDGTPTEILQDKEVMAAIVPLLRADFSLEETYAHVPGHPLEVPITVFGAADDHEANLHELNAWQLHCRQACQVRILQGNHFYLRTNPAPVVEAIRAALAAPR
jgi:surfactin synthase thioesterase subunit